MPRSKQSKTPSKAAPRPRPRRSPIAPVRESGLRSSGSLVHPSRYYRTRASNGHSMTVDVCDVFGEPIAVTTATQFGDALKDLWLSPNSWASRAKALSGAWERFRYDKMRIHYVPDVNKTVDGSLCLYWDADAKDDSLSGSSAFAQAAANEFSVTTQVSEPCHFDIRFDRTMPPCYVTAAVDSDWRLEYQGHVGAVWGGITPTTARRLGWLYVEYTITFLNPSLDGLPATTWETLSSFVSPALQEYLVASLPATPDPGELYNTSPLNSLAGVLLQSGSHLMVDTISTAMGTRLGIRIPAGARVTAELAFTYAIRRLSAVLLGQFYMDVFRQDHAASRLGVVPYVGTVRLWQGSGTDAGWCTGSNCVYTCLDPDCRAWTSSRADQFGFVSLTTGGSTDWDNAGATVKRSRFSMDFLIDFDWYNDTTQDLWITPGVMIGSVGSWGTVDNISGAPSNIMCTRFLLRELPPATQEPTPIPVYLFPSPQTSNDIVVSAATAALARETDEDQFAGVPSAKLGPTDTAKVVLPVRKLGTELSPGYVSCGLTHSKS